MGRKFWLLGCIVALLLTVGGTTAQAASLSFAVEVTDIAVTLGNLSPLSCENHAEASGTAYYPQETMSQGTSFSTQPAAFSYSGYYLQDMQAAAAFADGRGSASGSLMGLAPLAFPDAEGYLWQRTIAVLALSFDIPRTGFYEVALAADYRYARQTGQDDGSTLAQAAWQATMSLYSLTIGAPGTSLGAATILATPSPAVPVSDAAPQTGSVTSLTGPFVMTAGRHTVFCELNVSQRGWVTEPLSPPAGNHTPIPASGLLVGSVLAGLAAWRQRSRRAVQP